MKEREKMTRIPLSRAAKAFGVQWMIFDGAKSKEDVRRMERTFIESEQKMREGKYTYDYTNHSYILWEDDESHN